MRSSRLNMLGLLTVAAVGLAGCGGGEGAEGEPPAGEDAAQLPVAEEEQQVTLAAGVTQEQFDLGEQLFTGQGGCQACHGPNAQGTQLAPNLRDSEWINISGPQVQEIADLIRTGVPQPMEHPAPMPPMGGANLTDEQVQALAAYVASIGQGEA